MKVRYFILFILILSISCKDEFLLESKNYNQALVVEGLISNDVGPYTVKLSMNAPAGDFDYFPLENCKVSIVEDSLKKIELTEIEPGVYSTTDDSFIGTIGKYYSLSIVTPDNKEYGTEPQIINEPVQIDSIYAQLVKQDHEDFVYGLPGYQFYIDTKESSISNSYIFWKLVETYQYINNYELFAYRERGVIYTQHEVLEEFKNYYRCWKTEDVQDIFTAKTSNLTIPIITKHPMHFVGTDTKKLQERYSLLVNQYTINKDAFYFWDNIRKQISESNFLVVTQPYDIIGNVKNIANPNENVYGYFTVASVDKKRVFFDRPSVSFYYKKDCTINYDLSRAPDPTFLIVGTEGKLGSVKEWCVNCTLYGGDSEKPDFWIDKK